jgi:hypothetical protein
MSEQPNPQSQELEELRQQLAKSRWHSQRIRGKYDQLQQDLNNLLTRLSAEDVGSAPNDEKSTSSGVNPENMIWIFGCGRSGSTWLQHMMREPSGHEVWAEPLVGRVFGEFYHNTSENNVTRIDFIMGGPTRPGWIRSIRNFTLDGARYVHPDLDPQSYLVIQEINGSVGAPLLMEAIPESRMIFLVRDPRDVVSSALKRHSKGGQQYRKKSKDPRKKDSLKDNKADNRPDSFVKSRAENYLRNVGGAREAYKAHQGRKVMIRYEDLRYDTLENMKRIYAALEVPIDEGEVAAAVEKHAWESIPKAAKGVDAPYRKATPGGWREDLTPKQIEIVEQITAPLLEEFYPA